VGELKPGQTVNSGANVGVIAGLIILAMEISKNNRFLAAEMQVLIVF